MTLAEVERVIESKRRLLKEKAVNDYTLANLIGYSVARIYNSRNKMPSLSEAYPALFIEEEIAQEQLDEVSAIRFLEFANNHNKKYKEVDAEQCKKN